MVSYKWVAYREEYEMSTRTDIPSAVDPNKYVTCCPECLARAMSHPSENDAKETSGDYGEITCQYCYSQVELLVATEGERLELYKRGSY